MKNLVKASGKGIVYHYTHDTEGRVLSKRAWERCFKRTTMMHVVAWENLLKVNRKHPMAMIWRGTGLPKARMEEPIMMQKATAIPSPKRTRSQTLYIRVECSFTNWMKIKIRQGIMSLEMNISGWITTINYVGLKKEKKIKNIKWVVGGWTWFTKGM